MLTVLCDLFCSVLQFTQVQVSRRDYCGLLFFCKIIITRPFKHVTKTLSIWLQYYIQKGAGIPPAVVAPQSALLSEYSWVVF